MMNGEPPLITNRVAATVIPKVIATAGTPTQIYRNSDTTFFEPKLMIISNPHDADFQSLKLMDYDLTDLEGDKDITKYLYPEIPVSAREMVILEKEDMKGWVFRYGIAGYVSTVNGLEVYVAGKTKRYLAVA